jgi:uncharacterized protein YdcH (DUF465 family)
MEQTVQNQLRTQLMTTNEEFRRLATQHADYARRLDELSARPYLTEQEQLEEIRLKKLKLRLKDEMHTILNHASPSGAVS